MRLQCTDQIALRVILHNSACRLSSEMKFDVSGLLFVYWNSGPLLQTLWLKITPKALWVADLIAFNHDKATMVPGTFVFEEEVVPKKIVVWMQASLFASNCQGWVRSSVKVIW